MVLALPAPDRTAASAGPLQTAERGRRPSTAGAAVRALPALRALLAFLALLAPEPSTAHDVENTHVLVVFESDDTYRVDVLNDADWLWLQVHPAATAADLPPVAARNRQLAERAAAFARGMTLVFDGAPVAPGRVTYVPPPTEDRSGPWGLAEPGLIRLTGDVPAGAATFRFAYDRVVDEYPLTAERGTGAPVTRWLQPAQLSPPLDIAALVPLTPVQVAVQ